MIRVVLANKDQQRVVFFSVRTKAIYTLSIPKRNKINGGKTCPSVNIVHQGIQYRSFHVEDGSSLESSGRGEITFSAEGGRDWGSGGGGGWGIGWGGNCVG